MILNWIDALVVKVVTLIARVIMPTMMKINPIQEEERMTTFINGFFGDLTDVND